MTVYVLGAGASRHVGYPFAKTMGTELFAWMKSSPKETKYLETAEFFESEFGAVDDFEELISKLQQEIQERKATGIFGKLPYKQDELVRALIEWFTEIRIGKADGYEIFTAQVLKPQDVIITFNYDDSLDRELKLSGKWEIADGYGFQVNSFTGRSEVLLLKLHGSVNWTRRLLSGHAATARPVFNLPDLSFLGYLGSNDPEYMQPLFGFPTMILPTRDKRFFYETNLGPEWAGFWDRLWLMASGVLKNADEIVICGYGLLPVDERACTLLLSELAKEAPVKVCCGTDTPRIVQSFKDAGYGAAQPAKEVLFEAWTQSEAALISAG